MTFTSTTIGGISINILNISDTKQATTIKQKVGYNLIQHRVPETTTKDWVLTFTAELISATKDTDRVNVVALDDLSVFTFNDGMHNGEYIIMPGTLQFSDGEADAGAIYRFTCTILQFQQVV